MRDTPAVVVMGVSGCGKSTIGALLAERTGATYIDADDLHSAEAVEKMAGGTPLTDDDRWPWLDRVAARIAQINAAGEPTVVACSALRRVYRDRLRAGAGGPVFFAHLAGHAETIAARMVQRQHFMPSALLQSQLATLEELAADERGARVDIAQDPERIVADILAGLDGSEELL